MIICDEKLGKVILLERMLKDLSRKSKITQFGLVLTKKSMNKIRERKSFAKTEKMTKFTKIKI